MHSSAPTRRRRKIETQFLFLVLQQFRSQARPRTGTRDAVNQLPKSVVREIRTPPSFGTGGGRPPPVTRWAGAILVPTATVVSSEGYAAKAGDSPKRSR